MRRLALLAALAGATTGCAPAAPPARRVPTTTTTPTLPTTTAAATTTTLAPTSVPPTTARRRAPVVTTTTPPEGNEGAQAQQLAAIARCESGGRYDAVSRSGRYRGAHQWSRDTWNGVASRHRPDLVGDDPAAASPADQDEMAGHLYAERGSQPWPTCG